MNRSLWFKNTQSPGYRSDRKRADVIVIGAGLTGLAAAWRLCREGLDVLVLEAAEVGSGTSGHTTGKITSQHHLIYHDLIDRVGEERAKIHADANQWAVEEYVQLIKDEEIECHLEEQAAYLYAHEATDLLEGEHAAAVKLGLPSSLETVPFSRNQVLCFRRQAQFHPREFMLGLADRIVDRGGAIAEQSRVLKVTEHEVCTVSTQNGTFEADSVIYATLFPVLDHTLFAMRLRPVLHYGMAFSVEERKYDGMYLGVDDLSLRYFGNTLIAIGGHHSMGSDANPYVELERKIREKFEVKNELSRWSAHDQQSPDGIPFIGSYEPLTKKQFAATGFNAWGISHAMVAAKIFADKIVGRENPWADFYSPWRTGKIISMAVEKATDTLKSLVKGKHLCPHMGCGLVFNEFDQTYDCPCHGSRFDHDGQILWGPATKGILAAGKKD